MDWRAVKSIVGNFVELAFIVYNTTTGSTKCKGRADNCREPDYVVYEISCVFVSGNYFGRNAWFADCFHCVFEHLTVFGLVDCCRAGAEQLNVV